jgi:hypothetical protein
MPLPIICANAALCQFVDAFASCLSKPQRKYFVTVLLALLLCEERRTLTGLLRKILDARSLCGLSRFLSRAPWSETKLAKQWQERFYQQVQPGIAVEHQRQMAARPKKRGHPKATVVTGFLILDDSTHPKVKGEKMGGLGHHWSSTLRRQVKGHSLFQALYAVLGRLCPLPPQMYCTKATCQKEGKAFLSKIDLALACVQAFVELPHTKTHVLSDAWYQCQALWRVCRKRGFAISGGIKSNRRLRCTDAEGHRFWQTLSAYASTLKDEQFVEVIWPSAAGGKSLFVHRVRTRIKKLGACQVLVVRPSLDASLKQTRYFVSSLLEADTQTIVDILAVRWEIETFFDDLKELFGSDHYQLMSQKSILRFWTLCCCAYAFLEEQRAARDCIADSLGSIRRRIYQEHHQNLLHWLREGFQQGQMSIQLMERLAA